MFCKISRAKNIEKSIAYLLGVGSKEQAVAVLNNNEVELIARDLDSYDAETTSSGKREVMEKIASSITSNFNDRVGKALRAKNCAPYFGYISFAPNDPGRFKEIIKEKNGKDETKGKSIVPVLRGIISDYIKMMGLQDTQHIFAYHYGTNCMHIHFAISSILKDGRAVDNHFLNRRSDATCAALEKKYQLVNVHMETVSKNKQQNHVQFPRERYHDENYIRNEARSNERYNEVCQLGKDIWELLLFCPNIETLQKRLKKKKPGYDLQVDDSHSRLGLVFSTPGGDHFSSRILGRRFSYGNIQKICDYNAEHIKLESGFLWLKNDSNGGWLCSKNIYDGRGIPKLFVDQQNRICELKIDWKTNRFSFKGTTMTLARDVNVKKSSAPVQGHGNNGSVFNGKFGGQHVASNANAAYNRADLEDEETKSKREKQNIKI